MFKEKDNLCCIEKWKFSVDADKPAPTLVLRREYYNYPWEEDLPLEQEKIISSIDYDAMKDFQKEIAEIKCTEPYIIIWKHAGIVEFWSRGNFDE